MAKCDWCKQEMNKVDSCTGNKTVDYPDGTKLPSSTRHFDEPGGRCHDCNVKHGEAHHPGCDVERCPKCKGQLISCGCLDK
jgi:hypothetical protein